MVTGIIQQLKKAVEDAGFTHAEYTGTVHSGLERFKHEMKFKFSSPRDLYQLELRGFKRYAII